MRCTYVLPLKFKAGMVDSVIYPVVLKDENGLVLIDCGFPGFLPNIEKAVSQAGFSLGQLTKLILTHHDQDHMGSLKEITDRYPDVKVYCSEEQAPYVTGKKEFLRLALAKRRQEALTTRVEKLANKKFMDQISRVRTIDRVTAVRDGELLPVCGGVRIIDTSGHMPGHICVYIPEDKTLVAGDALLVEKGKLSSPSGQFTLDMDRAVHSLHRLLDLELDQVICYHGGPYTGEVKTALRKIIDDYEKR